MASDCPVIPLSPPSPQGDQLGDNDVLYFADVCAGPGGFSEYVLWRKRWRAKGFGFTLRGEHDFKLHDFHAGPAETFEPHYGRWAAPSERLSEIVQLLPRHVCYRESARVQMHVLWIST